MKRVLLAMMLTACGGAKAKTMNLENTASAPVPAAAPATATDTAADTDEHKPGSRNFPNLCCCVDGNDSTMAWDGPSDCQKGTCTDKWTDACMSEGEDQETADSRADEDAECPSDDRHDCDGDGVSSWDDKDDNDPKVH